MPRKRIITPEKRVERIKRLLDCESDSELARLLETKQPQIARWKRGEFSNSMAKLVDLLFLIISRLKRETNKLKKEIDAIKQSQKEENL